MKPEDKAEFAKVVLAFAELKGKALSLPAVELYWACMQDWEIDAFKRAALHLLKTAEFMPQPKDFEDLRKASDDTSGEAFAQAVAWTRSGDYRTPAKSERGKRIDRAVQAIGGYQVLAMCEEDKLHFLERRFTEHFESMQDSDAVREALPDIAKPDWLTLNLDFSRKRLTNET